MDVKNDPDVLAEPPGLDKALSADAPPLMSDMFASDKSPANRDVSMDAKDPFAEEEDETPVDNDKPLAAANPLFGAAFLGGGTALAGAVVAKQQQNNSAPQPTPQQQQHSAPQPTPQQHYSNTPQQHSKPVQPSYASYQPPKFESDPDLSAYAVGATAAAAAGVGTAAVVGGSRHGSKQQEEEIASLKEKLAAAEKSLADERLKHSEYKARNSIDDEHEKEIQGLRDAMQASHAVVIDDLKNKLSTKDDELSKKDGQLQKLDTDNQAAKKQAEDEKARADALEEELALIKAKQEAHASSATELETQVAELVVRAEAAEALVSELQKQKEEAQKQKEQEDSQAQQDRKRVEEQDMMIMSMQQKLAKTKMDSKVAMEEAVKQAQEEAQKEVLAAKVEVDNLKNDLQEAHIELMDLQDTRDDALNTVQNELQDSQDAEEATRKELEITTAAKERLEGELGNAKKQLAEAEAQIKALIEQRDLVERKRRLSSASAVAGGAALGAGVGIAASQTAHRHSATADMISISTAPKESPLVSCYLSYKDALQKFAGSGLALAHTLASVMSVPAVKPQLLPAIIVFGQVHQALYKIRLPQYYKATDKRVLKPLRTTTNLTGPIAGGAAAEFAKLEAQFFVSLAKGFAALDQALSRGPEFKAADLSPEAEAQMFSGFCNKLAKAIEGYEGALIAFVVMNNQPTPTNSAINTFVVDDTHTHPFLF